MTIFDKLKKESGKYLPMHMPGHKRKTPAKYLKKLSADIDITEIDGFDDLHDPSGIIAEAQERAASLWGAEHSHILVGGSTVGILAGIYSCVLPSDEIILSRNCHKSVYHAIEVCGAVPKYIMPEINDGIFSSVSPELVKNALASHPKAKLVVITSPTYDGVISDIEGIAAVCHEKRVPLLVDEAHGAHLGLSESFPAGAVKAGADIVVQSLHKTLPSLTQTALAHVGGLCDDKKFSRALDVFETSSPSYLLMASADGCFEFIKEKPEAFAKWREALSLFYDKTASLKNLKIYRGEGAFAFDESKIVISTKNAGITGFELMKAMREQCGIELEMASLGYAVAMTGLLDSKSSLSRLAGALKKIDKTLSHAESASDTSVLLPKYAFTPKEAAMYPQETVFSGEAEGCVSAECIWAYPPGIPMIVSGEVFSEETILRIKVLAEAGADIKAADKSLKTFKVVKKLY